MCPPFERLRRQVENDIKTFERDPVTKQPSTERCVKCFARPAAGQPPPLPSDVRPPKVLVKTLDYLITNILSHLPSSHAFLWDRTRSIRQDFTFQNYNGDETVLCCERIARIHILSCHVMASIDDPDYSRQQELEQFTKTMQTLLDLYDEARTRNKLYRNEPEFRAYHLLSAINDAEADRTVQLLPPDVFYHPHVQTALKLRALAQQNNQTGRGSRNTAACLNAFAAFFRALEETEVPFLMTCLLETHFVDIRIGALRAMARAVHKKSRPYSVSHLARLLGFDDIDSAISFCETCGLNVI
ncbi:hypothetical protein CANCADRAFT_20935, partial [Tortispora caseinolytica NRRL Y-17796]